MLFQFLPLKGIKKRHELYIKSKVMLLTYNELDTACRATITQLKGYPPELAILMNLYYKTGCRPVEGVEEDRWSLAMDGSVRLVTAKSGFVRSFHSIELPAQFYDAIESGFWPFPFTRLAGAEWYFRKVFFYPRVRKGDKQVKLYAFRYRYVKMYRRAGWTDKDIAEKMAWADVGLVDRYANAELYSE